LALRVISRPRSNLAAFWREADINWPAGPTGSVANDAVDGAHSAASKCHRVVAFEQTTLRGAVHGRG
jgi:hypothetical protein